MEHLRRTLLTAGLSALAGAGLLMHATAPADAIDAKSGSDGSVGNDLDASPQWKHLTATWNEASQIGQGLRGDYPFSQKDKDKLLTEMEKLAADIRQLRSSGLLSDAEAELLRKGIPDLLTGVREKRPTEMRMATCYEPMPLPAPAAAERLSDRLPLLEKLAASRSLRPQVISKVLESIEEDLANLSNPQYLNRYKDDAQRQKAIEIRDAARKQVDLLKAAIAKQNGELEKTPQWQKVTDAWKQAAPLAQSHKSTTRQREDAKARLDQAVDAARQLADRGMLSAAEAELLASDAEAMQREIYREPPTDSRVSCYDMAYVPPARESLDRMSKRLPLLRRLAQRGHVHPAAILKLLPGIEADLKVLSSDSDLATLPEADRNAARDARNVAAAELQRIKALLPKTE